MTGWKICALQVPPVVPHKALGIFSKALYLYGTMRGTCSVQCFRPVVLCKMFFITLNLLFYSKIIQDNSVQFGGEGTKFYCSILYHMIGHFKG